MPAISYLVSHLPISRRVRWTTDVGMQSFVIEASTMIKAWSPLENDMSVHLEKLQLPRAWCDFDISLLSPSKRRLLSFVRLSDEYL